MDKERLGITLRCVYLCDGRYRMITVLDERVNDGGKGLRGWDWKIGG